ncbi:MAG: hypothetical protein C0504_08350 [Candidatus Solibacter sp.]|nr:hypothetical protein [Candidatus Solibacter sp.]
MNPDMEPVQAGDPRVVIGGWKGIAAHYEVTPRTAQLWESTLGLPVHRETGSAKRVFAYADELDAWMAAQRARRGNERPAAAVRMQPGVSWVAGATMLLAASAAAIWLWPGGAEPEAAELRGRNLVARDAGGRVVWQYAFPNLPDAYWSTAARPDQRELTRPMVGDFDGDGRTEVLFTNFHRYRAFHISELYCFESDGTPRWKYRPGRTVRDRKAEYSPPYTIRAVIPIPGRNRQPGAIAVVSVHYLEHPAQVSILSLHGKLLGEYWHSGYFFTGAVADLESDGRHELYLAGISNANREATVVVLDPYLVKGAAREADPDFQISGLGGGEEVGRILLPATEFTRQTAEFPVPTHVQVRDGRLVVTVRQNYSSGFEPDAPEVEYQFGPRLIPLAWGYTAPFDPLLERLAGAGIMRSFDVRAEMERTGRIRVLMPWREAAARNH